jgi:outer membrane murein-binding lipoprotein Lpp
MPESTILTEDEVAEIEAQASAATEGPWVYDDAHGAVIKQASGDKSWIVQSWSKQEQSFVDERENGEFIAHARTDIPALCQTVRALRAALEESEAHARILRDRLVVADGVYTAKGDYTLHAQSAISRAVSELQAQLATVTQERDQMREQLKGDGRKALARMTIQAVEAEHLESYVCDEADFAARERGRHEEDIAYDLAINHVVAALRELFQHEGIEIKEGS